MQRKSNKIQGLGKRERHYVKLDLLKKMPKSSELFADFMTRLISAELEHRK